MSGLCGWFDPGRAHAANAHIDTMAATLARFDGTPVRSKSALWGAVATAARGANGDVFQDGDRLAAVYGRARFSDARLVDLAQRQGVACALAEGYVQRGTEVLKILAGSFALAILDRSIEKAFLAVDRMGTRSLCYTTEGGNLVFGSTLDAIGAFPGSDHEISQQAIYDYVYFHMVPGPQTLFAHRKRLLPGTFLTWDNGRQQTAPYWEMRFTEDEKRSFPDLKNEFLALVRKGVEDVAQEGSTGTFLSGGTDSSTVAGMLREVTGEAPRTYSIGFDAHGFDEISYARIAARHFGARHNEYYVTPDDVANAIPRIAAIHDQPFGNSSAVPTYYCAKLARDDGVDTLLEIGRAHV